MNIKEEKTYFSHVHKPIRIRNVEIKNRVVRSAHNTYFGVGTMSDDLIAYHEARARGGVGLTVIEIMSVHPTSPQVLPGWDPALGDGYRKLVDTIRPHGMKLFQQLWHGGHNGLPFGTPLWSASDIASPLLSVVPIPMTKAMIDEVVASYAQTARHCEEWGLEGVEIHCAHGYLPGQFLSPALNRREDDYGGSFENRARFALEVATAVRAAVSDDFVVGVRVSPDIPTVTSPGDILKMVQMLEARDLIDFVSVSAGSYFDFGKMIGGMHEPVGYELPTSTPITRHVKSVTMVAGRFRTLDDADLVIREGDADMVVMTRATIADPDLVNKSLAGEGTRVRPCIGCNQGCLGGLWQAQRRMGCVVNPAVGFERSIGDEHLVPATTRKKVLVIGGGVTGMEAARVAALRGHQVILAEAGSDLGGTANIAAKAPTRHGIHDIAVWQEQEIYMLGVDVRLSTYVELDDVLAMGVDAVIIATGAQPRMDGIQLSHPSEPIAGFDRPNVISSHDLFMGKHPDLGKTALVIDDVGHYEAIGAAEELVNRGLSVTYVTRHSAFGAKMEPAFMTEQALRRLCKGSFSFMTHSRVIAIEDGTAVVGPSYLPVGGPRQSVPADTVVFVSLNRPDYGLYHQLVERGIEVKLVGDAQAPRFLDAAIREGYMAGADV
ncbi:MAG: FAD-dependent oxidoreductase [Georgfuchsia sp.]